MSEKEGESAEKKSGFFVKIKKSFKIGKKVEKESTSSLAGKSEESQKSTLKYVNLIPTHKLKKKTQNEGISAENVPEEARIQQLVNDSNVSSSSEYKEQPEDIRLDVGKPILLRGSGMSSRIFKADIKQTSEDEEEQLRLYREMHEVRKQMILKEKKFQEEKLEFYKLQLDVNNILEQQNLKE